MAGFPGVTLTWKIPIFNGNFADIFPQNKKFPLIFLNGGFFLNIIKLIWCNSDRQARSCNKITLQKLVCIALSKIVTLPN